MMKEIKLKGLDETIYYDECDNGLQIYVWENKKINTFNATLTFLCGAEDISFEIHKKKIEVPFGTAHYLEHMMFHDEKKQNLLERFQSLGSYSNAYTTTNRTVYEFVGTKNFKECLHLLLDSLQVKNFDNEAFERERGPILEEARMRKDNPEITSYYQKNACLFQNYPNQIDAIGTMKEIENMKKSDLDLFYETFYHPKNSFITVTGPINPLEVITEIKENQKRKTFPKWNHPKKKVYKEPKKVMKKYAEMKANVETPKVLVSVKIPKKTFGEKDEMMVLNMLSVLLASNFGATSLFREELFDKKLAVSLGFGAYLERDYYILNVTCVSKYPNEVYPFIEEKLQNLEIDDKDIKRKVKSEVANLVLGYENAEDVNDMITFFVSKFGKVYDNEKEIIEEINGSKIKQLLTKVSFHEISTLLVLPKKKEN